MGIKITQPIQFDSTRPNFERDIIDSSIDFISGNPLAISEEEGNILATRYDVGHIVWDINTNRHYVFMQTWLGSKQVYCFAIPSVENTTYTLNTVDAENEIIIFENQIDIDLNITQKLFIPIKEKPSDWDNNWDKYYIYETSFIRNKSKDFNPELKYYLIIKQ